MSTAPTSTRLPQRVTKRVRAWGWSFLRVGDQIAYQRERPDCDPSRGCFEQSEIVLITASDTDPARPVGTERGSILPLPADISKPEPWSAAQRHVVARWNPAPVLGRNPRPDRRTRRRHASTQLAVERRAHRNPRQRDPRRGSRSSNGNLPPEPPRCTNESRRGGVFVRRRADARLLERFGAVLDDAYIPLSVVVTQPSRRRGSIAR